MNHLPFVNAEKEKQTFFTDTLANVLKRLTNLQKSCCLQAAHNGITFFIHFNEGKLIYATNSLAPFERLERQMRRLSNQNPQLDNSIIKQPRDRFTNDLRTYIQLPSDYQSILWLSTQGHLTLSEAGTLLRRITREVFESFLCLPDSCQYRFVHKTKPIEELHCFELAAYIQQCYQRVKAWNAFANQVWSTYQRPYLVTEKTKAIGDLTPQQNQTICKLLKGLNFRQISAVLDLDELAVAKLLYPSILDSDIIVRDPKAPFDRLPKLPEAKNNRSQASSWHVENGDSSFHTSVHNGNNIPNKIWKVVGVDSDTSSLRDLSQYLDQDLFFPLTIHDPLHAFSQIIEFNPDLILLGAEMPDLNGYELCELLRNHHDFNKVPIIIMEQTKRLTGSGRFKAAGATDKLPKPFNRIQLLSLIQQYLNH